MTERLYYQHPERRTFDAVVTRVLDREGRPAVHLDRTAFYPTSGGQPFDTGRLGEVDVIDTIDEDEEIVHVLSAPLAERAAVRGDIDWTRRFDHMQQHTGQHVLSAAFDRLFDNRTMSFHMGADASTIDLAREMSGAEIERAVDEANRVVWEDRPVTIRAVSPEEAAGCRSGKSPCAVVRCVSSRWPTSIYPRAAALTWRAQERSASLPSAHPNDFEAERA
jgi:alanyl-tRNA synthetase